MKKIIVLIILFTSQFTIAQNQIPIIEESSIEVSGLAKMEIVPDQIFVSIHLLDDLKNDRPVDLQEGEMKKALTALGINLENLSLSNANADFVRVGFMKKDVLKNATYALLLQDANQLGKVFAKLDELDVNRAYISKLDHSNRVDLRKELRIKAIKLAKEKADYLLNAIGEKTGTPITINESSSFSGMYNYKGLNNIHNSQIKYDSAYGNGTHPSLNFEKISIESSINVKFRIE